MAFPTVASTTPTVIGTAATTHPVAMPATVDAGDLLLVAGSVVTGATTAPAGGGWTLLHQTTNGAIIHGNWYKIADGTEGGTSPVWTTAVNRKTEWHTRRITGWHGTTPPEIGTAAVGTSTGPDPPSLSPSWGSADTLWIVTGGFDGATTVTTYPTNYSTNGIDDNSTGPGGNAIGSSWRTNAASSEDPDAFLISASQVWVAQTIAVRPAAGGVTGTAAVTLGDFTSTASGTVANPVTGTSAQTLGDFTSAASGTVANPVTGTATPTLGDFTSTAAGTETISGTSAQTLGDFTSVASGVVANPVTGTAAVTLGDFTSTASGQETISGTSAQTLADFTSDASGTSTEGVTGTVAVTLGDFTSTASGTVVVNVTGTAAVTLGDFTSTATGVETITGTSGQTLADFTSAATGTVASGVTGTSAVTLADFIAAATGTVSGTTITLPASGTISDADRAATIGNDDRIAVLSSGNRTGTIR